MYVHPCTILRVERTGDRGERIGDEEKEMQLSAEMYF
jgi:hypothetical protein